VSGSPLPGRHTEHVDRGPEVAIEAVRRFAAALDRTRTRLFDAYPDLSGVRDLMVAVRSAGTLPREGRSSTGVDYSVHGAGCVMIDEQGHPVDVDLVDGVEAFDAWRIRQFLGAERAEHPSLEELSTACSYLSRLGEVREVKAGRWYALPGR
jgi:hypothetical protein